MARLETISTEGGVMITIPKYGFTSTDPAAFHLIRGGEGESDFFTPGDIAASDVPMTPIDTMPPDPSLLNDPTFVPTQDMGAGANQEIAQTVSPQDEQMMQWLETSGGMSSTQAAQVVQANTQYTAANQQANQEIISAFNSWKQQPLVNTTDNSIWTKNADGSPGQMIGQFQGGVFVPSPVTMPSGGSGIPQFDSNGNIRGYYQPTPDGTRFNTYNPDGTLDPNGTTDVAPKNSWLDSMNAAIKPLSSLLATPAGKLLGALGIGAATTGLGALIAGNPAKVPNAIRLTPNAATVQSLLAQGQGAALKGLVTPGSAGTTGAEGLQEAVSTGLTGAGNLADLLNTQTKQTLAQQVAENPAEQGVAMKAIGQLPGELNATTNPNITGTARLGQDENLLARGQTGAQGKIMTGLGTQVENVLNGNYSNPILENQIKMARDAFNAKMYAQLGPGWETSTPGMQAKEQQDLLESSQRFTDKNQTLATDTPLYTGMLQGAVGNQQQATGQVQQAQAQGVTQDASLSQLGKAPTQSLAQGLNAVAPATSYAGLDSAAASERALIAAQQQSNMQNTQNTNNTTATLAKGVAGLGGSAINLLGGASTTPSLAGG